MRLSPFIRANSAMIVEEWETFAATLTPATDDMSPRALRDHINPILEFAVADMESPQSNEEQVQKSRGAKDDAPGDSAAETHAAIRLAGGFNLEDMISEFRALRASVTKLWQAQLTQAEQTDLSDLTRFNEVIDQQLTEAVKHYTKKFSEYQGILLDILGSDIRNPLASIEMASKLTLALGPLNERQEMLVTQNVNSAMHAMEIATYLLDLTTARYGSGMRTVREPMDMVPISQQLVDEMRTAHPARDFKLEISGDAEGEWDKTRIGQVFSNLLGNAVRYSSTDSPIIIKVAGSPDNVTLSVHNEGVPIPADVIGGIFDSFMRAPVEDGKPHPEATNLGLGLYIAKEIVDAHGGTISVASSEKNGTTFTVQLPRRD